MSILDDTFFQTCDRFITKEQWNKHLFSGRHLHREQNGYWPAYFLQKKLTRNEGIILEKTFWEMTFASEDVLPVYGILKTYIMMVKNMKDFVRDNDDGEDDDKDYFCYHYRDITLAQFKQDFYMKNSSLQDQCKCAENDNLKKRINFLPNVFDMGVQNLIMFINMIKKIL